MKSLVCCSKYLKFTFIFGKAEDKKSHNIHSGMSKAVKNPTYSYGQNYTELAVFHTHSCVLCMMYLEQRNTVIQV